MCVYLTLQAGEGNLSPSLDCCSVTSFYIAQLILIQHIHDGPSRRGAAQVLGSGDELGAERGGKGCLPPAVSTQGPFLALLAAYLI